MPSFSPFAALRYDPARFAPHDVTAPPYDVLSPEDRAALVARNPHNAVLVDLPVEADGDRRYAEAGARVRSWVAEGVLVRDPRPSFTAYRMTAPDDRGNPVSTLGVIGALELSHPEEGQILPHEHTTPKAKSDRLDLLRGTRCNLSAIWGLSLTAGLSALLLRPDEAADATWADEDGTVHETWRIDDEERVQAIERAVGASPVVIADGHHRFETSLAYRAERTRDEGDPGTAGATLCFVVELSDEQLTVRPIHRLVHGAGPDLADRLASLEGAELVGDATADEVRDGRVLDAMSALEAVAIVGADGAARLLRLDPARFSPDDDLDSARVAAALGQLELTDLTYQHGTDRAQAAVLDGDASSAILIRPVTVAAIEANAHAGRRMPPKSTFFHPKPRTGIVFRTLD